MRAQIGGFPPPPAIAELDAFDKPEILRKRPDGMLLKLAQFGIDMSEIDFFHQPNPEDMAGAQVWRTPVRASIRETTESNVI